jgi:glycosyltransferase involved in cell wall biosynthesis
VRVLLIAEACNPEWVSVPLVGWSHARAIAALTDAHLVTQVRNRAAILRAGLVEGRDFTTIDTEAIVGPVYRFADRLRGGANKGWTALAGLMTLAYPYFEHLVWKQLGEQIRRRQFDIVHRLTPLSPAFPSFIAKGCRSADVPFIVGPLNGGLPWPAGFGEARQREGEWPSWLRELHRLVPGYYSTRRNASAILAASRTALAEIPRNLQSKSFYIPENAIDPARFTRRRQRRAAIPLKLVFIGRLVPCKAVDLLLTAAAPLIREGKVIIDIVGDGPEMPLLRRIVANEKLEAGVNLAGWVEHAQVQDRLVDADLLAFPSIRDFGGGVVLEAMAVGIVPMVVAYGGPGELVTDKTGFVIPIAPPAQIVESIRYLLTRLVEDPPIIDAKSERALGRAHTQFTWAYKAQQVVKIYNWARNPIQPRPQFQIPWPDLDQRPAAGE